MGLERTAAEALSGVRCLGADFTRTLTLGRQWLMVPPDTLREIAALHGADAGPVVGQQFAEPFFAMLGARTVDSLDRSAFEGATLTHDLNDPEPSAWHGQYDLLFDGGTLEHVFNVPQGYRNGMDLLRVGGVFVQVVPGNNFMGHGFWQFSPELMFRVFSADNGFETLAVLVQQFPNRWRHDRHGPIYLACDPDALGWRVELRNQWPTHLLLIARKVRDVTPFRAWPQQSDYARQWREAESSSRAEQAGRGIARRVRALVPPGLERWLRPPFRNKAYLPLSRADLIRGRLPG